METHAPKAVFISYASQDAEAARRMAEALSAGGVEVWFDQSELRGGDAWDQKIRKQIQACALFVPLISAATQTRLEGYFRIEWNLAAQRTHAMAAARPFLLPVVIDATRDADAHVPPEFKTVQWTRVPTGEAATLFVQRVQALLASGLVAGAPDLSAMRGAVVEERAGDRLGHYRLIEKLGEGGYGTVWLAEQEEPVRRRVAVKIIKLGMDTKEVIARFEVERQALALMDHPNIAKVFDAGASDTGRPYFVMELVQGVPITAFCDERKLSTTARLELLIQVCHAVQHAHQKGIIHRDLKPSNILVALHDDLPVPKVIDFGVAKATAGRLTDQTLYTTVEHFIGTPAYMSPEQAQVSVVDIDTRSDIYSLGVLLYELLTGRTPFDTAELLKVGLDEMRRHIREVDPPRPSTRLSTLQGDALSTTAQRRQIPVPKLLSLVRGDLDWIVMRCLEKDRARRYETANGLAADLTRHLHHEPVSACPPSQWYRLRKLVRRNKLAFAAGAAVAAALVLGMVVSTWQAVRASRAERTARTEAKRADDEAAVSKAVNEFLVNDLLKQADSRAQADAKTAPNPDLKVREALDRAGEKVGERFEDHPLTEAAVREAIGSAYTGVGDYAKASRHYERTLQLRKRLLGAEHPSTASAMNNLASANLFQGRYAEAAALHAQTLEIQKRVLGPEHRDTLSSAGNLANVYYSQGKEAEAAALHTQTLEIKKRVLGPDHPDTLTSMNNLALAYYSQGKDAEAAALHAQTLEIRKRVLGPEHPNTLVSMTNLGSVYYRQGKDAEAAALHAETLEIKKRVLGPDHPDTLSSTSNLASVYYSQGRYAEAAALHAQTLERRRRVLGPEHPNTLVSMSNLALAYDSQGKDAEAAALHAQTLETRKRVLGPEHPDTLMSMNHLANFYQKVKDFPKAETLHRERLELTLQKEGADSSSAASARAALGRNLLAQQKFAGAEPLVREALAIRERKSPDSWQTFNARCLLGRALVGQKNFAAAEPHLVSGYEGMKQRESTFRAGGKVFLKESLEYLVGLYTDWGKPDQAAEWQRKLDAFDAAEAKQQSPK
ncbi:MAG: tetratricopeptide repeat protein [Verrucomicrobia bacterium]|nr:tetratricopeptide repeat protein [Verrucomicrobiota bacterium]